MKSYTLTHLTLTNDQSDCVLAILSLSREKSITMTIKVATDALLVKIFSCVFHLESLLFSFVFSYESDLDYY